MMRFSLAAHLPAKLAGAAVALAVFGAAPLASAHDTFPGAIQEKYGLGCAPQCSLCHISPNGGGPFNGSNNSMYVGPHRGFGAFGWNLNKSKAAIINFTKDENLIKVIESMKTAACNHDVTYGDITDTAPCDSDGDGQTDYDEVTKGFDPDHTGQGNGAICPQYGCGASIGTLPRKPLDSGHASAALAALGVALVVARRLRR